MLTLYSNKAAYIHVLYEAVYMYSFREGEVKELERQVQEMRESVTQLQLERTELHTKVTWF